MGPQTFQEALRRATPIGGLQPRHNTFDVELHGVHVPAGSLLKMVDYSANHDERVFADPERFDIHRDDLYTGKILRSGHHKDGVHSHLGFGVGTHLCPGAWISTQESVLGSQIVGRHLKNPTSPSTGCRRTSTASASPRSASGRSTSCGSSSTGSDGDDRASPTALRAVDAAAAPGSGATRSTSASGRVQATPLIRPGELRRTAYLSDPYRLLGDPPRALPVLPGLVRQRATGSPATTT